MSIRLSPGHRTVCPDRDDLLAFSTGRLPPEQSEVVAGHLDGCSHCLAMLDTLDDDSDSLTHLLRSPVPTELIGQEACQAVLNGLDTDEPPPAEPETGEYVPRPAADPGSLPPGWGDYRVLAKLGQGGMGAVYKAVHTRLGKVVAVKVLPAGRVADPRAVARFHREMEAVGALEHPNLVRALDAREEAGVHLLVMEYLEGTDLGRFLHRHGPLPVAVACEVVRQAAVGLQYAHERFGLVHRDLKPSNLMLTPDGTVKVLDLGLARLARPLENGPQPDAADLTSADECLGTYDYMAPEQWLEPSAVDVRADIYSLGCTLFQLLTGRLPYSGPEYDTPGKKMRGHAGRPLPPWPAFRADIPAELHAVLERMTAKEPARRFASPGEVAAALAPFCASHDLPDLLASRSQSADPAPAQPIQRAATNAPPGLAAYWRQWVVGGIGAAAVAALIGLILWAVARIPSPSPTNRMAGVPQPEVAAPKPNEPVYLPFPRIKHFRLVKDANGKDELRWLGWIGDPSPEARQGDRVKIEAETHQGYLYLIAVDPDGTSQLLFPENEAAPPALGVNLTYPTAPLESVVLDQPGPVCFVLLAARRHLPPFAGWRPPMNARAWNDATPAVPWSYNGTTYAPLMQTRVGKAADGPISIPMLGKAADGPKPLVEVCRFFQSRPDVLAVRAVLFAVRPEPPKPGGGKP